jgi:hypothetical protein
VGAESLRRLECRLDLGWLALIMHVMACMAIRLESPSSVEELRGLVVELVRANAVCGW